MYFFIRISTREWIEIRWQRFHVSSLPQLLALHSIMVVETWKTVRPKNWAEILNRLRRESCTVSTHTVDAQSLCVFSFTATAVDKSCKNSKRERFGREERVRFCRGQIRSYSSFVRLKIIARQREKAEKKKRFQVLLAEGTLVQLAFEAMLVSSNE